MRHGTFEFFQLRCFVAVAKELNFRRAAAQMNMTQPPLSRQIKLLEHGLGVSLLNRDRSGVSLTPAGEDFLASASELLQRAEAAVLSARQAERGEIGSVAIGFVPSAALDFVPRMVVALKTALPAVTFTPMEMMSYEIIEGLRSGRLDLGLTRAEDVRGGIRSVRVVNERFVLALPKDHPLLAKQRTDVADLDGVPMIGYSAERGGVLRGQHATVFAAAGIAPRIVQEASQTHTVLALVNSGLGVALVPQSGQVMQMANLAFRDLDLPDHCRSSLYLNFGAHCREALHARVSEILTTAMGEREAV